ncbi:hypothetical protein VTK26DRAFT_6807 [Humicola hyalothermophila]
MKLPWRLSPDSHHAGFGARPSPSLTCPMAFPMAYSRHGIPRQASCFIPHLSRSHTVDPCSACASSSSDMQNNYVPSTYLSEPPAYFSSRPLRPYLRQHAVHAGSGVG